MKRRNSNDDFTDFSKDPVSTLDRKISKVGNKKSDKFLGENLSSCLSNSPFLASTPIFSKKVDDSSTPESKDALEHFVESNVIHHDRSPNTSNFVDEQIERPKVKEVNQSQPPPIQMHIQYSTAEKEQRPTSLLNAARATVNDSVETADNLNKRAEFLMTMVDHEFSNAGDESPQQTEKMLVAPKRRKSKNLLNEEPATSSSVTDVNSTNANTEPKTEVIEQVNDSIRSAITETDNGLKLDLSQKKKEFPKSNPDSPNIYAHLQPVVHELIVPVRKHHKHICDDDDEVHKHLHKHSHPHKHSDNVDGKGSNSPDAVAEHVENEKNVSPKKPDRDFSRYRKSADLSILEEPRDESLESIIESQIIRPERKKGRSISRDSLPSPPPRPVKLNADRKISLQVSETTKPAKSRKISLQEPMRGLFEEQKLPDTPVTPANTPMLADNEYEKIESFLKVGEISLAVIVITLLYPGRKIETGRWWALQILEVFFPQLKHPKYEREANKTKKILHFLL